MHELKTMLTRLTKPGLMSDYLRDIKELTQTLATARDVVKGSDIVFYTLVGLPS